MAPLKALASHVLNLPVISKTFGSRLVAAFGGLFSAIAFLQICHFIFAGRLRPSDKNQLISRA
ncbi:hypothetical protein [Acidocella aquatica]|uniref:hypothetical protein n=1 Tax=Acidocella aquatica TaxID=1922313 RepID=UPI0024E16D8B|nr:hypothetical protein [Acidocella aquatica]